LPWKDDNQGCVANAIEFFGPQIGFGALERNTAFLQTRYRWLPVITMWKRRNLFWQVERLRLFLHSRIHWEKLRCKQVISLITNQHLALTGGYAQICWTSIPVRALQDTQEKIADSIWIRADDAYFAGEKYTL